MKGKIKVEWVISLFLNSFSHLLCVYWGLKNLGLIKENSMTPRGGGMQLKFYWVVLRQGCMWGVPHRRSLSRGYNTAGVGGGVTTRSGRRAREVPGEREARE